MSTLQQVLKKLRSADDAGRPGKSLFRQKNKIERSPEFLRISNIETRNWEDRADYLSNEMTPILKTEHGQQTLRPVQAAILYDLGVNGGAIGIIRVGGGKTLICFLAPICVQALRPLLVVPGSLLGKPSRPGKTERDLEQYRAHWKIPRFIRIVSYEWLAHKYRANFFNEYKPDLVMLDEGHRCKDTRTIVTQMIKYYRNDCIDYHRMQELPKEKWSMLMRYWDENKIVYPLPKFLVLSGTLTRDSIRDYWHMLRWTLPPENIPLPLDFPELYRWSMCLDARVKSYNRVAPGALLEWCNDEERKLAKHNPLKAARQAFRRRLHATPGIICSQAAYEAASLRIEERRMKPPPEVMRAFRRLREMNETPAGFEIQDGSVCAQRAMELSLGFFGYWKYPPPLDWMVARREWCQICRYILAYNRKRILSEAQVKDTLDKGTSIGKKTEEARGKLAKWRKLEPKFTPEVDVQWISDFALKFAAKWAKAHKGVVWVFHPAFGERLSEMTGMPYYHSEGFDSEGNYVENHPHGEPMIVSIKANMFGKNLQFGWSKALMMYTPGSGEWWEQIIGRLHREGQRADEVEYHVFVSCIEHVVAFWKARGEDAEYVEDTALKHKLLFADIVMPRVEELAAHGGSLWTQFDPSRGLEKELLHQ